MLLAGTPERTVRNAAELCEVGPTVKRPYEARAGSHQAAALWLTSTYPDWPGIWWNPFPLRRAAILATASAALPRPRPPDGRAGSITAEENVAVQSPCRCRAIFPAISPPWVLI